MAEDLYARLLQAEPQATAQRKRELRDEAGREARQSPPYFDLTFSLGKSTSLFHASLGENARRAHEDGDSEAEAFWAGEIAALDEMIYAANEAALAFFQAEAGIRGWVRTPAGSTAGRRASGARRIWPWPAGISTPAVTVTRSCTCTTRSCTLR